MNKHHASTIYDISQGVSEKHEGVSKRDVEVLFEYFYQKVVKNALVSFATHQFTITHFGTFNVNTYPDRLARLRQRCESGVNRYKDEILKPDSPSWMKKQFDMYSNVLSKLEYFEKYNEEYAARKVEKRKERQEYVRKNKENNKE